MKNSFCIKVSFIFLLIWEGVPQASDRMEIVGIETPGFSAFTNSVSETLKRPPKKPFRK